MKVVLNTKNHSCICEQFFSSNLLLNPYNNLIKKIFWKLYFVILELFRGTEGTTQVHQPVTSKPTFLQACKQFAGKAEDGAYEMETVTRSKYYSSYKYR